MTEIVDIAGMELDLGMAPHAGHLHAGCWWACWYVERPRDVAHTRYSLTCRACMIAFQVALRYSPDDELMTFLGPTRHYEVTVAFIRDTFMPAFLEVLRERDLSSSPPANG